jgi:putative cell wall-binding protein
VQGPRRVLVGVVVAALATASPSAAQYYDGPLGFDGEPATVHRLDAGTPRDMAILVSRERRTDDAGGTVVLARDDDFADALAGAPLTADGMLLLTPGAALDPAVRAEIDRVLPPGALVYLLGGTAVLSAAVEQELVDAGYETRRLAGPTRIETAVAVAGEVLARRTPGLPAPTVVLARATGTPDDETAAWADSITAGAWAARTRSPVLLTPSDALHPATAEAIEDAEPDRTVLVGGEAALSREVEQAVPDPVRVAGTDRAATAVAVLQQLWAEDLRPERLGLLDLYRADGWAFGLAATGGLAEAGAPLLAVTRTTVPPATAEEVRRCDDLLLVGDRTVIGDEVVEALGRPSEGECPPPPAPPAPPPPPLLPTAAPSP